MVDRFQFARGTASEWTSANPTLLEGEIGFETDTGKYKIGDGGTAWTSLAYTTLSGQVSELGFDAVSDPSAPSNGLKLYAKSVGGRVMPKWVGPAGIDTPVQPFLAGNSIGYWRPQGNSTTVPGVLGYGALTAVGTATARNVATTSTFTRMRRIGYVSAATVGALTSLRQAAAQITLGDGSGNGGFMKVTRFGISDAATVAGARMFVGVSNSVSAPTNVEPSTILNCVGVGHGAADTNLKIFYGGSTAQTPIDLGADFPITAGSANAYELTLFSPPNENGVVKWRVVRLGTAFVAEGTINGSGGIILPATTTLLSYMWAFRTNNATALAVGLDLMSDYIETDY